MNPRAARQASGMTRNEWARAMGVSVLTTKRWEQHGSGPRLHHSNHRTSAPKVRRIGPKVRTARSPTQHRVERMERVLTWCGVDLREVMG